MDGNEREKRERRREKRKHDRKRLFLNKVKYALRFWYVYVSVIVVAAIVVTVALINGFRSGGTGKPPSGKITTVNSSPAMKITFIDVGQGDCAFVEFPDGKTMLVDAGDVGCGETIDAYIKGGKIDYCVATHSDADHTGSMGYVYEKYEVGYSFRPYEKSESDRCTLSKSFNSGARTGNATDAYLSYLTGVANEDAGWSFFTDKSDFSNAALYNGEKYGYRVDFLMPYAARASDLGKFSEPNDFSAIFMITFAGRKVLFTGDAEERIEETFLSYYRDDGYVDCDVLKVGHHGSGSSSSTEFLKTVKPEYAVISCSALGNDYGHPHRDALARINMRLSESGGATGLFRTDIHGTITLAIDADGNMTFSTEYDELNGFLLCDGSEIKEEEEEIKRIKGA